MDARQTLFWRQVQNGAKALARVSSRRHCFWYTAVLVVFFPSAPVCVTTTVRVLPSAEMVIFALRTTLSPFFPATSSV